MRPEALHTRSNQRSHERERRKRLAITHQVLRHTAKPADPPLTPVPSGSRVHEVFRHFAHRVAIAIGSPIAFVLALATIVAWAICGPLFGFSTGWQLVINTGTTIITFLVVFVIQNTQNRESKELHFKLDELIRSIEEARNRNIDVEDLSDEELARLEQEIRDSYRRSPVT